MPVVAVAAIGWGAATVAATGLVLSFSTVAAIGAIAGGIGALTGNAALTKVGAVMGLVGGVGGLASSAGMFAGEAASEIATGAASDTLTGSAGADAFEASTAPSSVITDAPAVTGSPALDMSGGLPPAAEAGLMNSGTPVPPVDAAAAAAATGAAPGAAADTGLLNSGLPPGAEAGLIEGAKNIPGVTTPSITSDGFLEKYIRPMGDWAKANPLLAFGASNLLGGGLSMLDPLKGAQTAALEAQTKMNQERIAAINAAQPRVGVAATARPNVYGGSQRTYQQPAINLGLINQGKP